MFLIISDTYSLEHSRCGQQYLFYIILQKVLILFCTSCLKILITVILRLLFSYNKSISKGYLILNLNAGKIIMCRIVINVFVSKCGRGLNEEYLHNTRDWFWLVSNISSSEMCVFLTKIYSKLVKCIFCIVKIFIWIHTFSTLISFLYFYKAMQGFPKQFLHL